VDVGGGSLAQWAVLLSPAGIVIGWYLNEISARRRTRQEREDRAHEAKVARVLAVVRTVQAVRDLTASLAYHTASRAMGRDHDPQQAAKLGDEFNDAQRDLRLLAVEVDVLGPAWLSAPAADFTDQLSGLNLKLIELGQPYTDEKGTEIQAVIDDFIARSEMIADLARRHMRSA
jgi:hypothetical protein